MRLTWLAVPLLFLTGCPNIIDPPHVGPPDIGDTFDFDGGSGGPPGPQPSFGETVTQSTPPPPLSGGTLLVLADGHTAIAADPDRDRLFVADVVTQTKLADLALEAGDEPGRAIEDAAGRVHVVTRRGGAVVTLQPPAAAGDAWTIGDRRAICPAPRGIAYQAAGDQLHVACAGGELITLPAGGGAATRTVRLERDLRDVVVESGVVYVSQFRSAHVFSLDANGQIIGRTVFADALPFKVNFGPRTFTPEVAWRMVPVPGGGVAVVHQRGLVGPIGGDNPGGSLQGGYGGSAADHDPCSDPIVQTAVSYLGGQLAPSPTLQQAVLPINLAFSKAGVMAVVAAGHSHLPLPQVMLVGGSQNGACIGASGSITPPGEATSVAFDGNDNVVVQLRQPAALYFGKTNTLLMLSTDHRPDTGHAVFHANAGGFIACASCHPEGGDDGRAWEFAGIGVRRTQSLRGGIRGTEPFHWDGDMKDFGMLVKEVFNSRMSGPPLLPSQLTATLGWVDKIPRLPQSAPADPAAVARGKLLFEDTDGASCTSCHNGPRLTNNVSLDVGTGGVFQVPSLVGVAWRAPFLHDGCAPTLRDRFGSCGGGDLHGRALSLPEAKFVDLLAYLETL